MNDEAIICLLSVALIGIGSWWIVSKAREQHCAGKTVTAIGGCDRNGMCGVVYSDGSRGTQSYPTVGGKCE